MKRKWNFPYPLTNELTGGVFPETTLDKPVVDMRFPEVTLRHGQHALTVYATVNNEVADWIGNAGSFPVEPGCFFGPGILLLEGKENSCLDLRFRLH